MISWTPGHQWWALRVSSRGMMPQTQQRNGEVPDFPAVLALERHGFDVYVLTEHWSRRRNRYTRQRVTTRRPLIPGLVLLRWPTGLGLPWHRLHAVPYVIGFYGILRAVGEAETEALVGMERRADARPSDPYLLRPGMRAEIISGAMVEQEVDLQRVDVPEGVARGLIEVFGGKVEIVVPLSALRVAGESSLRRGVTSRDARNENRNGGA